MKCTFGSKKLQQIDNIRMFHWHVILNVILVISFNVRHCCAFVYTGHSGFGCFVAVAVPLSIPNHNVFVSYNFEAVYGLPQDPKVFIEGAYQGFVTKEDTNTNYPTVEVLQHEESRKESELASSILLKNESRNERKPTELITKRVIHQMIKDKFKVFGFNGEACLLKLICEVNSSMFGRYNGVLGTILHILLVPSSSAYENLPKNVYKAEENGTIGDCSHYEQNCPYNILDIFSVPIEDFLILNDSQMNKRHH